LKTLLLGGNLLRGLQISGTESVGQEGKEALWFPNVTMLDLSENLISDLSPSVALLSNLSVLNLNGNKDLTDLPPQLGLLSRVWNLSLLGCNLQVKAAQLCISILLLIAYVTVYGIYHLPVDVDIY
jgi:Leucine-rich repeat (LRR) protein